MGVIIITAIQQGPFLISGIPNNIILTTNVPSTIFFTLDGSEPNMFSQVYLEPITLPTTGTIRLRALAISGPHSGKLDVTYSTDSTDLAIPPRRLPSEGGAGVVVDAYGVDPRVLDGYKPNDAGDVIIPARYADKLLKCYDIKYSRVGPDGYGPGTLVWLGPIPEEQREEASPVDPEPSSPNDDNVYFNPRSLYIVMDGRDGYEDQSVYPINRPWGSSLDVVKYLQGRELLGSSPYVSGSHIKTFYNPDKGIAVAYYLDMNEQRWIKSIQNYNPENVPQRIGDRRQTGQPLVFRWVYNKRSVII
jgi:hypothetical protein